MSGVQILNDVVFVQTSTRRLVKRVPDQPSIFKRNIVPDAFAGAVEGTVQLDQIIVAEVINGSVPQGCLVDDQLHPKGRYILARLRIIRR